MIKRLSNKHWILLSSFGWMALAGCSYSIEKQSSDTPVEPVANRGLILGYNSLRAKIFVPHCIICHGSSGGVNLESYASAFAAMSRINNEVVVEGSMPPSGALADSDRQLVASWINAGGSEVDIEIPEPTPTPSPSIAPIPTPTPLPSPLPTPVPSTQPLVTYANVQSQIFTPQCIRCHNSGLAKPSGKVTLDSYNAVISFLSKIENELLVDQSMPPSGPLSTGDQALFQAWVNAGTPQ
jgi:mono/diheme cytochrome c family protein